MSKLSIDEKQVPLADGGGVVCTCKLCGASWWADEENFLSTHNYGCPSYETPAWAKPKVRKRVQGAR